MWGYIAASVAGSLLSTSMTNKSNMRATRENNAHQLRMSSTAHQREVKDLKSAGLNPILSARSSGAPQPSSAAAKVEPYNLNVGEKLVQAEQIKLLEAQSAKTRAEAVNTQLQEPYNKALADVYGSIAGVPAVGIKALGGVASGYGLYKGAKAVGSMLRKRKSKRMSSNSKFKSKSKKSGPWHSDDMNRRYHESRKRIKKRRGGVAPSHLNRNSHFNPRSRSNKF